jgi:hypothetical protein
VNLRTRWVQVFDHSAENQTLGQKERFLARSIPEQSTLTVDASVHRSGVWPFVGIKNPEGF